MRQETDRPVLLLWILALAHAALLLAAAAPTLSPHLWGTNAWTFLPLPVLVAVSVAALAWGALVFFAPPFPTRRPVLIVLALGAAVLFNMARDRTHLLGDGRLWINALTTGRHHHANEPLAFAGALAATMGSGPNTPAADMERQLEWYGVLLGAIALILLLRLAWRLGTDRRGQWAALGLLGAAGTSQFAFGYIEAYPALWVALLVYFLAVIEVVRGERSPAWAGAAFGMAAAVHVWGVTLLPATLLAIASRRPPLRTWILAALPAVVAIAGAYAILPLLSSGAGGTSGTPGSGEWSFVARELSIYPFGPANWLLDQMNAWALAAPLALGLAGLSVGRLRERPVGVVHVLAVAAVCLAAPAIVLHLPRSRGIPIDWDLLSVTFFGTVVLAAAMVSTGSLARTGSRLALAFACGMALFGTAAFIASNARPASALRRFEAIAAHSLRDGSARGWAWEALAVYHRNAGDEARAAEAYRESLKFQTTNQRLLRNTASMFQTLGRNREAAEMWGRLARLEPNDATVWFSYAAMLEMAGSADSAAVAYREVLVRDPGRVEAMNYLARILSAKQEHRAEAIALLNRSLELSPAQEYAGWCRKTLKSLESGGGRKAF
jgi:tetratricopeptide (TPR) repeat protein